MMEGGDAQAGEILEIAGKMVKKLKEEGMVLENALVQDSEGNLFIADRVHVDVNVVITVDGAMLYAMCDEKCGGSAHEPCNFCHALKRASQGCSSESWGNMFVMSSPSEENSGVTIGDVCLQYGLTMKQLIIINDPSQHEHFAPLTTQDGLDVDATSEMPMDLNLMDIDETTLVMSLESEEAPGAPRLRVPFRASMVGPQSRPLLKVFRDAGITWEDQTLTLTPTLTYHPIMGTWWQCY